MQQQKSPSLKAVHRAFQAYLTPDSTSLKLKQIITHLQSNGLFLTDPRLAPLAELVEQQNVTSLKFDKWQSFLNLHPQCADLILRALTHNLVVPDFRILCEKIKEIYERISKVSEGRRASYIPQLATIDQNKFGIAVCTVDGQEFSIGDAQEPFCVQSCSKPVNYLIAVEQLGTEQVHKRVGKEPSGMEFNKIFLNKDNLPHNPMINSGAITICSMIKPTLEPWQRYAFMRNYWQQAAGGRKIGFQNSVFMSERETGDKNKAIINLLMDNKVLPHETHLEDSLNLYFQACSLEANCRTMASIGATLANSGENPFTKKQVFNSRNVTYCLELMLANGLYDQSGDWAFKIGVPAKSGVSGCIFMVIPPIMGISVWSPPLNHKGNSVKGILVSQELTQFYSMHRYDTLRGVLSPFSEKKNFVLKHQEELMNFQIKLFSAAAEDDIYQFQQIIHQVDKTAFNIDKLVDHEQRTVAHVACLRGAKKVIKELIHMEADFMTVKDSSGDTPLEKARQNGNMDIVKRVTLLQEKEGSEFGSFTDEGEA